VADARMQSTVKSPSAYPTWDMYEVDGECPILTDSEENQQAPTIAAFIQKGTIPQLPSTGVPWTGFFMGQVSFGSLDMEIRDMLTKADCSGYEPSYEIVEDQLYTTIKRST